MKKLPIPVFLVFILFPLLISAGQPEEEDRTLAPYFRVINSSDLDGGGQETFPLKSTNAEVVISGVIANVEVRQVYQNRGHDPIEAIYVFPGSTRSAVHGLTMKIEDRTIEAEIREKDKAREEYEVAKAEGKSASLLEQHRPNVFQMNVANILPGDSVEVVLKYTELITPVEKVYEFQFPTVVGPRYPGDSTVPQEEWVASPYLEEGVADPTLFDISVRIDAGLAVQDVSCETHPASIEFPSPESVNVSLTGDKANAGNRDFILRYRLAGGKIESGLLLHEAEGDGDNFFLLTMQPPKRITPDLIPAREYIFVVDVSGSMSGFPLDTAKELMRELVGQLKPTDQFNILTFAGSSDTFSMESVDATAANLKRALRWMSSWKGGGGTELVRALNRAIHLKGPENVSRSLVVVTDGYVSFERDAFDVVSRNLGQANLFAFGIGGSVNRYLIEGMARVGRGEPFVVTEPKLAKKEASKLAKYISQPVLTSVDVEFEGFDVYDVQPESIPDVLADRPVTVFGKWRGKPKGKVVLSGVSGEGDYSQTLPVARPESTQPGLPYLWARDRIAHLSDYKGRYDDPELREQITNLGLTYSLLTEYTSFVAVDDVIRRKDGVEPDTVKQPLPLPQGVPASAVGGGSTPAPGLIPLLITAISTLLGRELLKRKKSEG